MPLISLCPYSSDSDLDDDNDEINPEELFIENLLNRMLNKIEKKVERYNNGHESDSDLSEIWSSNIDSDDNDEDSDIVDNIKPCITKGELTFEELPKIEKLNINSSVEELTQIGIISSIVDRLVIVDSFKSIPVLDLDSILFKKNGEELAQIFDVIGPVKQPNYVLRFNSNQEIRQLGLEINSPVYYNANFPEPYTKYVFINNLIKEKGSDASWKDNNEPPPEALDYSDDETERIEKWKRQAKSRCKNISHVINID